MKLNIYSLLDVEADSLEELEKLIDLGKRTLSDCADMLPTPAMPEKRARIAVEAVGMPNVEKWSGLTGKRLKMSAEECGMFGEGNQAREQAAINRLQAMGESIIETGQSAQPSESRQQFDIDPDELV